jgi:hypothetical protein
MEADRTAVVAVIPVSGQPTGSSPILTYKYLVRSRRNLLRSCAGVASVVMSV